MSELPVNWVVTAVVGAAIVGVGAWYMSSPPPKIHNRSQLVSKLSGDDSDTFVWDLIRTVRKEQPSPQVAEGLLESIVLVMPDHARMVLVKKLIEEEVKLTETEATLFRSNALATKAMTKIAKQVGQEYIEALLIDFVKELCKKNEDMEVFPSSVAEGVSIEKNANNVEKAFAVFFDRLESSIPSLPWQIRLMVRELYKESVKRYPKSSQTVIGGFLLLRFICPALVMPGNLTSLEEKPTAKVQRGLITIAKILQNISNRVKWSAKEDHMVRFNHMIDDYLPRWTKVLEALCEEVVVPATANRSAKPATSPEYDSIEKELSFFAK